MTRSLFIVCVACVLGTSVVAEAAPATTPAARAKHPATAKAAAKTPPAPLRPASPRVAAAPALEHSRSTAMPRTLEDVHIEGEVPVPQVLFITARDQRRFMDFQHHRYLKNSAQLGEATPFPTWVAVIHGSPTIPGKEPSR